MGQLESLARTLGQHLQERGETLATAESCTGGMIASALTSVEGSSVWFGYGFVTYSNEAKQRLLGVTDKTLHTFGAVSAATAVEMAQGALLVAQANWALAVTGIAGPGGGSAYKPVGTVWFAIANPSETITTLLRCRPDQRNEIRRMASVTVLQSLINKIQSLGSTG